MIAFGIWVESWERYRSLVRPALAAHGEADALLLESQTDGCVFEAHDEILTAAAQIESLEALVLLHDHVEIRDPQLVPKIRDALHDRPVALLGAVGARNVTSLRWWEGEVVGAAHYPGGTVGDPATAPAEAHVVDDALLVLTPHVVRSLRCDRRVWAGRYGSAAELSALTRVSGGHVGVLDLDVVCHQPPRVDDVAFLQADLVWRTRWSYLPEA
jgi:hypothetical protein